MPTLSITKTYADGNILTEADLDAIRTSIQTFFNTTGIDSSNVQAGGIGPSDIGINDSEYLEFGTSNDGRIGVVSDDLIVENVTTDKDIIFKASDNGVATEVMRVDGSEATLLMNSKQIKGLAAGTANTDAVNLSQVKERLPTGVILPYGAHTAPTGYLLCDGSAVSRTTYADLFAAIGVGAGSGDGSTTFNVPDLRGRFLRGRDEAVARDPDAATRTAMNTGGNTADNVFSLQSDANKSHSHTINGGATGGGTTGNPQQVVQSDNGGLSMSTGSSGSESRPINAYVVFIIKT